MEKNIRWERKAKKLGREGKVWEIVNREKEKEKNINKGIG